MRPFLLDEEDEEDIDALDTATWAASLKTVVPKKVPKPQKPVVTNDESVELPEGFDLAAEAKKANVDLKDLQLDECGGVKRVRVLNKETGGPEIEADEEHVTFVKRRRPMPATRRHATAPVELLAPAPKSWKLAEITGEEEDQEMEAEFEKIKHAPKAPVIDPQSIEPEIRDVKEHRKNALSSTAEFAQSLATPIEKIEEERATLEAIRKRIRLADMSDQSLVGGTTSVIVGNEPVPLESQAQALKETPDLEAEVLGEAPLDGGMKSALEYLKRKGELKTGPPPQDDLKLDYTDEYDNALDPKGAFQYMSWHFHGKGPGSKKMEKRLMRMTAGHESRRN